MRWKIFYGDGSTYSGPPENAPGVNLQVVVLEDKDHGRRLISGGNFGLRDDYYWWDAALESWWCGDIFGLIDYLQQPGWKKVVFGRSIGNDAFAAIYKRAKEDPDFPPKTGWAQHEKPK